MTDSEVKRRSGELTDTLVSVESSKDRGGGSNQQIEDRVRSALDEDGAFNDITTIATVVSDRRSRATLTARQEGVIAGVPLALEAFRLLDPKASIRVENEDGAVPYVKYEQDL